MMATSVSTATMLTCVALAVGSCGAGTGPASSTRSESPGPLTGVHWRLQKANGPGESTVFPSTIDGWLETTGTGAVTGSDGCALFSANSNASGDRLRLSRVTQNANGCIADHGPLDAMRQAVEAVLLSRRPARVTLTSNRLVFQGSSYVLTYVNEGPSTHGDEPTDLQTSGSGGAK